MPLPLFRNPVLAARGNYSDLLTDLNSLEVSEIVVAVDRDQFYVVTDFGGSKVLSPVGATTAQGLLADTAIQTSDLAVIAFTGNFADLQGFNINNQSIDELNDVDTSTTPPVIGQTLKWDGSNYIPANESTGSGVAANASELKTTASLSPSASQDVTYLGLGKAGNFTRITVDQATWVTFYVDAASRSADSGRQQNVAPLGGSGVLLDIITPGAQTVLVTPVVGYFNNDTVQANALYATVRNAGASTTPINVTVDALVLLS